MKRPTTPADAYAAYKQRVLPEMGKALASLWGPPPTSERISDAEKVRLWNLVWPREPFSPDALAAHLQRDPEDPQRHPSADRAAELLQLGFPNEAAVVWQYPYREDTYRAGNPDPEEFTREAERISRLAAKSAGFGQDSPAVPFDDEMEPGVPALPVPERGVV